MPRQHNSICGRLAAHFSGDHDLHAEHLFSGDQPLLSAYSKSDDNVPDAPSHNQSIVFLATALAKRTDNAVTAIAVDSSSTPIAAPSYISKIDLEISREISYSFSRIKRRADALANLPPRARWYLQRWRMRPRNRQPNGFTSAVIERQLSRR